VLTSLLVGLGIWLMVFFIGSFIRSIASKKIEFKMMAGAIVRVLFHSVFYYSDIFSLKETIVNMV